ncbi:MAG: 16S rRNA (guanine527-N7)-methyltransferase [Flavobacteriales bacterium]|jgi:16S rRNA (guanine527-N7)-methyltransferase
MELLLKYFPDITPIQQKQFELLKPLYEEWNAQINVISRKDFDNFYERHVIHALGIAKIVSFKPGSAVLDIGTGGGFPGIPLAIMFPDTNFMLVDSIGKKIKVVNEVIEALGLDNAEGVNDRAENIKFQFDFVVSRAVTAMPKFLPWIKGKFLKKEINSIPNGLLYLKGGDLREEMKPVKRKWELHELGQFFSEEFFETKAVIYMPM